MLNVALKLPRTVWFLGAVSFLNDAASDAIYPLLPLFFAATFAVGAQALGIIEGAANATAALMKLVSGYFYDRSQRAKGWLIIGYTLPALSRPLIALASSTPVVLLLRMGDRIGKGLESGLSLEQAIANEGDRFPDLYRAVVAVDAEGGEVVGEAPFRTTEECVSSSVEAERWPPRNPNRSARSHLALHPRMPRLTPSCASR